MNVSAHDVGQLVYDREVAGQVSLLALLSGIQECCHYPPHNALVLLSETLDLPLSPIYSVATFYHAFSLKPRGARLVRVCMGTACHVRGAPHILNRFVKKTNGSWVVRPRVIRHAFAQMRGRLAVNIFLPRSELNIHASDMTRGCNVALERVRCLGACALGVQRRGGDLIPEHILRGDPLPNSS